MSETTYNSNIYILNKDISLAEANIIVNSANGCGKRARKGLLKGVAESLNCATKGEMENFCLKNARKYEKIPSFICGIKAGKFFKSPPFGLNCNEVIHAVTMRYPASKSNITVVANLVHGIFRYCSETHQHSIAMPLLGTGTGGLSRDSVLDIIKSTAMLFPDLSIKIYINSKKGFD